MRLVESAGCKKTDSAFEFTKATAGVQFDFLNFKQRAKVKQTGLDQGINLSRQTAHASFQFHTH
jgi:hypothetical protein